MIALLAGIGLLINDFLAITSLIASIILFIEVIIPHRMKRKKDRKLYEWSVPGLFLAAFFQFSIIITGQTDQKVGLVFRISSGIVDLLLLLSFILIVLRYLISFRNRLKYI